MNSHEHPGYESAARGREHQESLTRLGELVQHRAGRLGCRRSFALLCAVDLFSTMVTQPLVRCV